jgi:hypothetical protein
VRALRIFDILSRRFDGHPNDRALTPGFEVDKSS